VVRNELQTAALYALTGVLAWVLWTSIVTHRRRGQADAWLAHPAGEGPGSDVLARRSRQLVAAHHRRMVGASLRLLAEEPARPRGRSARVPVDTAAVHSCAGLLTRAAGALEDVSRPVSPRAVALAQELITDPGSPVYLCTTPSPAALEERLRQTLFELERSL